MTDAKIAFIGGSGLYEMDGLTNRQELKLRTPFGDPSDVIVTGSINGTGVAFLPRHGRGHRLSPTEIPSAPIAVPRNTVPSSKTNKAGLVKLTS